MKRLVRDVDVAELSKTLDVIVCAITDYPDEVAVVASHNLHEVLLDMSVDVDDIENIVGVLPSIVEIMNASARAIGVSVVVGSDERTIRGVLADLNA